MYWDFKEKLAIDHSWEWKDEMWEQIFSWQEHVHEETKERLLYGKLLTLLG